jgi:hypothetical protein
VAAFSFMHEITLHHTPTHTSMYSLFEFENKRAIFTKC